jgi:stage V sporulation protein AD
VGKITDYGITDANNMGAAMAPAASDVIFAHLKDTNRTPDFYDLIITGDLGYIGKSITTDLLKEKGIDISKNYSDCGIEIYNKEIQDTHSGGSGCACSAVTFCGMLYDKLKKGEINKLLFVPTGALMSPTSVQQGENICGIAYALEISNISE